MNKRIVASLSLLLALQLPAAAAVTPEEMQAAIESAQILKPGTRVSVTAARNQAVISTYRSAKADEKDCKIDAALMAKAIMDLAANEISSVRVYFFSLDDLSNYDQITMSAGDIKAFASGELTKDQFLSSLRLEHHEAEEVLRISNYIQSSRQRMQRRPAQAEVKGDTVELKVQMEPWVQARDLQYEALLIASKALEANTATPIKQVKITFSDPDAKIPDRQIVLSGSEISTMNENLTRALNPVSVTSLPSKDSISVGEGAQIEERKALVNRLRALRFAGQETSAEGQAYREIEEAVKSESKTQLKARIEKLDAAITAREKSLSTSASRPARRSSGNLALSPEEIQAAVNKARVLEPGTTLTAAIKDRQVVIATYKNQLANSKDCKIDAILIAKAVMDMAPSDITSVTVYFFGRNDLSEYEQVTLTAGDIKAFSTGELTKEQLISSLALERRKTEDSSRISNSIQAGQSAAAQRPALVAYKNGAVEVGVQMEPWVRDRDLCYEAVRIAEKVLEASVGKNVSNITITFSDPDFQAMDRQVMLNAATLYGQLDPAISSVLATISVAAPAGAAALPPVVEGPLKETREGLAKRIGDLKASGVGVQNYVMLFQMIEGMAGKGDGPGANALINKLTEALNQQDATIKALKQHDTVKVAAATSAAPVVGEPWENRWALGTVPIMESRVLADPECYIGELQTKIANANANPSFWHALRFFAQTLRRHGQLEEASKFDARVYQMQRQYPTLR